MLKRQVFIAVFALLAVIGLVGSFYVSVSRGQVAAENQNDTVATVAPEEARVYASAARDRDVYAIVERYLAMQMANDREGLFQLLSPQHRESWSDHSYLLTDQVKELFDEARLEDLRLGVVRLTEDEAENDLAGVSFKYRVVFLRDGQIVASVEMIEALALADREGQWLIERNERAMLGGEQLD